MKKILPINESPEIITCIHHAYQCAIIESPQLAEIMIDSYSSYQWNFDGINTSIQDNNNLFTIYANKGGRFQDWIAWRKCAEVDELALEVCYIKPKDIGRFVDIFLFSDNYDEEIKSEDKSCGFRWNPYGYFKKKEMFMHDTKVYNWIRVCVSNYELIGYASKDGKNWIALSTVKLSGEVELDNLKIGIHAHFGENFYEIWKNMNFIQLLYNNTNEWKGIMLDYFFFPRKNIDNGYGYYFEFLETHYGTIYEVMDLFESIHEYLHWNISHYYYPEICLDEMYVPDREDYGCFHYNHYNLFFGFDDDEQVYYIMGYGKNHKPVVSKLPYSAFLNENFITSEKTVELKYASNDITNLCFDINIVKNSIYEFLNSKNSAEKFSNLLTQEPLFYGINIIKILATEEPKNIYSDRRISYCLWEHSVLMRDRLNFLKEENYLDDISFQRLIILSDNIVNKTSLIKNLTIKGRLKKSCNPLVLTHLDELYDLERVFFADLLHSLG